MTDTKILESRLITRDSAIGGSSLTRCVYKLQQYLSSYEKEQKEKEKKVEKEQERRLLCEGYCRELLLYKIEMEKFYETFEMCEQEIQGVIFFTYLIH